MWKPLSRRIVPAVLALLCVCGLASGQGASVSVVNLTATQLAPMPLQTYPGVILQLALDKTRSEYGDYVIQTTPVMNTPRALLEIKANKLPNQILWTSYQNRLTDDGLVYARFPIDYGATGYRICFVSPNAKLGVLQAQTLDELKRFSIVQGAGWADVPILRHNGFQVEEVGNVESGYLMVANGRADLFCRGVDELAPELLAHTPLPNLTMDRSMALRYPLLRVFIGNHQSEALLKRIEKGLLRAHKDGSLRKLWYQYYDQSVRFAGLERRRVFSLNMPVENRVDFDYQKYFIDPARAHRILRHD